MMKKIPEKLLMMKARYFKIMSDKHMGKTNIYQNLLRFIESGSSIWNATQQKNKELKTTKNAFQSTRSN